MPTWRAPRAPERATPGLWRAAKLPDVAPGRAGSGAPPFSRVPHHICRSNADGAASTLRQRHANRVPVRAGGRVHLFLDNDGPIRLQRRPSPPSPPRPSTLDRLDPRLPWSSTASTPPRHTGQARRSRRRQPPAASSSGFGSKLRIRLPLQLRPRPRQQPSPPAFFPRPPNPPELFMIASATAPSPRRP